MNISFMLTKEQIINHTKTVTRRLGWHRLKVGQRLTAVEKCQGLKKGEKIKPICDIIVTAIRTEPLSAISQKEVVYEGFPELSPAEFVEFFCKSHKGCTPESEVTVINFGYVCDFCDTGIAEWPVEWGNGNKTEWACQDCTDNEYEMGRWECKKCGLYFSDNEIKEENIGSDALYTCEKCTKET